MPRFKLAILATVILTLCACTKAGKSTELLEDLGYTNIKIKGYGWFMCSKEDNFHTKFSAVSPINKEVNGVVCGGLFFRGSTVRWGK